MAMFRRRSISLQDWQARKLTIEDIEDTIGTQNIQVRKQMETRLSFYNGPNPFVPVLPFNCWEKFKIFLFLITGLLIVKIILVVLFMFFAYLCSVFVTCGAGNPDRTQRRPLCRRIFVMGIRFWSRMILFVMGFYWISVNYPKSKAKIPRTLTPNHISAYDGFTVFYLCGAVPVAKKDLLNIPFLGRIMEAMGAIWIDRSTSEGRLNGRRLIQAYQTTENNVPPLQIFPQGTCSNTETLSNFKTGAFSNQPVQPIALQFPNCFCDMMLWTQGFTFIHNACQFINFMKVDFLEPYYPSKTEQTNASLFTQNVREKLALKLGATMTAHSFDDILLREMARLSGPGYEQMENFVLEDVATKLNMKPRTALSLGKIYIQHHNAKNGHVTFDKFCKVFHIKDTQFGLRIFECLLTNKNDNQPTETQPLVFEDFLVGVGVCYQDSLWVDTRSLFFHCMDRNGDGYISPNDIHKTIQFVSKNENESFIRDEISFIESLFGDNVTSDNTELKINFRHFVNATTTNSEKIFVFSFLQYCLFVRLGVDLNNQCFRDTIQPTTTVQPSTAAETGLTTHKKRNSVDMIVEMTPIEAGGTKARGSVERGDEEVLEAAIELGQSN